MNAKPLALMGMIQLFGLRHFKRGKLDATLYFLYPRLSAKAGRVGGHCPFLIFSGGTGKAKYVKSGAPFLWHQSADFFEGEGLIPAVPKRSSANV